MRRSTRQIHVASFLLSARFRQVWSRFKMAVFALFAGFLLVSEVCGQLDADAVASGNSPPLLTWLYSPDVRVVGCNVYYGIHDGSITNKYDATNSYYIYLDDLTLTGPGLAPGETNFVFVTSYDAAANESGPSKVLFFYFNMPPTNVVIEPASGEIVLGNAAGFNVSAEGTLPMRYQWFKDGSVIEGATNSNLGLGSVSPRDAGNYSARVTNVAGSATSQVAVLTVLIPPTITSQPVILTTGVGTAVAFTVLASGTWPLSYQWFKNESVIGGATNPVYGIASVSADDAGYYSARVTNMAGDTIGQVVVLTVLVPPGDLSVMPSNAIVIQGESTNLTVSATGTRPLAYQWRKEGADLPGATNAVFSLVNAQTNDAGNYSVVITNVAGGATSQVAVLTVLVPPTDLSIIPTNAAVIQGNNLIFAVSATGTLPLAYQWRKEGTNLLGATNTIYPLINAKTSDAGNYSVVITNMAGSATSQVAALTVLVPPTILPLTQYPWMIRFTMVPNNVYIIQTSSDLETWVNVETNEYPQEPIYSLVDRDTFILGSRFYRIWVKSKANE